MTLRCRNWSSTAENQEKAWESKVPRFSQERLDDPGEWDQVGHRVGRRRNPWIVRHTTHIAMMLWMLAPFAHLRLASAAPAGTEHVGGKYDGARILERGTLANGATLQWRDDCLVPVGPNVTCADLIIPERHEALDSRIITIRVAVLPTQEDSRDPDPFVFLMSGQVQAFSILNDLEALPTLFERDVITLEQRGTQLADPFFGCSSVKSGLAGMDWVPTSQPFSADPIETERCKKEISRASIDRNGYDTAASADDLWDLKELLGVHEWNLFRVPYGGRTAETFLRKHPAGARSLSLDSPPVTGIPFVFGFVRLAKIGDFISRCAAAEGCGRQFPHLKRAFEQKIAGLERTPVPLIVEGTLQNLTARAYVRVVTWIIHTKEDVAVA